MNKKIQDLIILVNELDNKGKAMNDIVSFLKKEQVPFNISALVISKYKNITLSDAAKIIVDTNVYPRAGELLDLFLNKLTNDENEDTPEHP